MTNGGLTQFSFVAFAVALVTVGVGTAAGLAFVPVVGSYLGMVLGGFVAGIAIEDRPLLESGLAAVVATLGILVVGSGIGNGIVAGVSALSSVAPTTLLTSIGLSFAVGAFGAHFGDDVRHGLTEPVEQSPSRPTRPAPTTRLSSEDESAIRDEVESEPQEDSTAEDEPASSGSAQRDSEDLELERE